MTFSATARLAQASAALAATLLIAGTVAPLQALAAPSSASATISGVTGQGRPVTTERRYCVMVETTGTLIRHRACKTAAEWARVGGIPVAD